MKLLRWTFWKMCLLALPLALAAPGQASAQAKGIIYVADGAVGQGLLVDAISQSVTNASLPLNVRQFNWSTLSEPTDFQSQYNFAVKGKYLASQVLDKRRTCPTARIYLVGFGAGTSVILKAAECLPPNTVDHILLLAPTVSCDYDLRPALLSSREGINSYFSPNDDAVKHAIKRFGTTDVGVRGATTAAGLSGFHALSNLPTDQGIYGRLYQERLREPGDKFHPGWHLGYVQPNFVRSRVVGCIEASLLNGVKTFPAYGPVAPMPPTTPPCPVPPPAPPQYPAPKYPEPQIPAPQYPAPTTPAPKYPEPQIPAPQYPAPTTPAPQAPAPQIPAPQYPAPTTPAPQAPAPQYPAPTPPTTQPPLPLPPGPSLPPPYPAPSGPQYSPPASGAPNLSARPAILQK